MLQNVQNEDDGEERHEADAHELEVTDNYDNCPQTLEMGILLKKVKLI